MPDTLTNLLYHAVFATHERAPLIGEQLRPRLHAYIGGIVRSTGGVALEVGGTSDHAHLLARLPPGLSVSDAMRTLKSNSSRWMNQPPRPLRLRRPAHRTGSRSTPVCRPSGATGVGVGGPSPGLTPRALFGRPSGAPPRGALPGAIPAPMTTTPSPPPAMNRPHTGSAPRPHRSAAPPGLTRRSRNQKGAAAERLAVGDWPLARAGCADILSRGGTADPERPQIDPLPPGRHPAPNQELTRIAA
jgi:REP element-mobilizing transposase RayT